MHEQCFQIIDKFNIVQARTVDEAVKILKNPTTSVAGKRTVYGRQGRYNVRRKPSRYEFGY